MASGITTNNTNNEETNTSEVPFGTSATEANDQVYDLFCQAAQNITLTVGSDAQDYVKGQKEDLKLMKHSIHISKKPKDLED